MIPILYALIGAALILDLRDDEEEDYLGLEWGRSAWMAAIFVATAAMVYMRLDERLDGQILVTGLSLLSGLAGLLIWSPGHAWILQPPGQQVLGETGTRPTVWTRAASLLFGHRTEAGSHTLDLPGWILASALRYCVPCCLLAAASLNPWVCLAGPLIILGYWPIAYKITKGEHTKYVGAAIAGASVYGLLGI